MREPPELADDAIVRSLQASYGIRVAALAFLPVGNDSASWAYRVQTAQGQAYFLKVRAGAGPMPGAVVPSHLHRHGVPHVLAPLASGAGGPSVLVDGFALSLYPMLDARTGAEGGLSPRQWRQLGVALRQVHAVPPTPELNAIVGWEAFRPTRRELIADLDALLTTTTTTTDPLTRELAGFWRARWGVVDGLVERRTCWGDSLPARAVQDIAAYGEQVLMMPTLGEETRRVAVDGFVDLFEPGNIVDLAGDGSLG